MRWVVIFLLGAFVAFWIDSTNEYSKQAHGLADTLLGQAEQLSNGAKPPPTNTVAEMPPPPTPADNGPNVLSAPPYAKKSEHHSMEDAGGLTPDTTKGHHSMDSYDSGGGQH